MVQAFKKTKNSLAKQKLLHHPVKGVPIALTSNASDLAISAVLEQKVNNQWQPLSFFSRQFKKAELKYAMFDKELMGVFSAVKHFKYYIEARPCTIFTDHKPIVDALHKKSEPTSAPQARQLAAIAEVTSDIRHVDGKNNLVADTLSRPDDLANLPITLSNTENDGMTPRMPFSISEMFRTKNPFPNMQRLKDGYRLQTTGKRSDRRPRHTGLSQFTRRLESCRSSLER